MDERLPRPEEAWDRFIDALDGAAQAGSAAGVRVPMFVAHVKQLSRIASALGGRADTILTIWDDMQTAHSKAASTDCLADR